MFRQHLTYLVSYLYKLTYTIHPPFLQGNLNLFFKGCDFIEIAKEVQSIIAEALIYKLILVTIYFYSYVFLFRFIRVPSRFYISTIAYIFILLLNRGKSLDRITINYSKGFPLVKLRDIFNNIEAFFLLYTNYNLITIIKVYVLIIKGSHKSISIQSFYGN